MNLARECLEKNARRIPNRAAVIDGVRGTVCTYAELDAQVNSMANALQSLGVGKGDRVALYLRNVPEFIVGFLAVTKLGAISVPFNIMLKKMEIEYILNHCEAKILFGMAAETEENVLPIWDQLPSLEKIISVQGLAGGEVNSKILDYQALLSQNKPEFAAKDVDENDGLTLLYTSGTTGKPKGALSTHGGWLSQASLNASFVVPMTD